MKKIACLTFVIVLAYITSCKDENVPLCETNHLGHILFKNVNNGFNPDSVYVFLGISNLGVVRSLGQLLVNNLPVGNQEFTFRFRGDTLYQQIITVTQCATNEYDLDWNPVSDKRLKQNIQPMSSVLPALLNLGTYTYEYNRQQFSNYGLPGGKHYGFMAQELQQDFAVVVVPFRDGYSAVNYYEMVPVLTKAIQEQQAEIDGLKKDVAELKLLLQQQTTAMK